MYVFPIIPNDEFAIWRIREGEPLYQLIEQQRIKSRSYELARREQDEQRHAEQCMRELSRVFGETIAHDDCVENDITLFSPVDVLRMLTYQLRCSITPHYVLRALSRNILLNVVDTSSIDIGGAKNNQIVDIILQASYIIYVTYPNVIPSTTEGVTNVILFCNNAIIEHTMSNVQAGPNARNIQYDVILHDVAMRAIRAEKIVYMVNVCMQKGIRHMYKYLAHGLAQNVLVCDISLVLRNLIPQSCWSAAIHMILQLYCQYTEQSRGVYKCDVTKACLYARDMILTWSKSHMCQSSSLAHSFDTIIKMMDETQKNITSTQKIFRTQIANKLYCAIIAIIGAKVSS